MSRNLIRISLNKETNTFYLEYGQSSLPGLTEQQKTEKAKLEEELMGFQDFTVAEDLDNEKRQELIVKKKRLEDLKQREIEPRIDWIPVLGKDVESLFLVTSADRLIYIENLPQFLIDKIIGPNPITINVTAQSQPSQPGQLQPTPPGKIQQIMNILSEADPKWNEVVELIETDKTAIILKPKGFIGEGWTPINEALKKMYGDVWDSKGKGDKNAHWRIPR